MLESDGYCEAICDGKHLHPAVFRLLLKTKGLGRVIAVTDSMMAAGMREGIYKLGNNNVVVRGGEAKIMGTDVHAGSILTTIQALRNMMEFTGLPVEKVVPLLTENPARMLGIFHRKGSLDVGKDADMVMLDDKYRVLATFSEGELLYQAGNNCPAGINYGAGRRSAMFVPLFWLSEEGRERISFLPLQSGG